MSPAEAELLETKLNGLAEVLSGRIDQFEKRMEDNLRSSRELYLEKIAEAQKTGNRAHARLDKQAETLKCLTDWKNQMKGSSWMLQYILTPTISAVVAAGVTMYMKGS